MKYLNGLVIVEISEFRFNGVRFLIDAQHRKVFRSYDEFKTFLIGFNRCAGYFYRFFVHQEGCYGEKWEIDEKGYLKGPFYYED